MGQARFGPRRGILTALVVAMSVAGSARPADEAPSPRARALALNDVTGLGPIEGQIVALVADPAATKAVLGAARELVKEKGKEQPLGYNACYILAQAAVRLKEFETSQVFFRLAGEKALKLRSDSRLGMAYLGLLEIINEYYEGKKYEESTKLCQDFLEMIEKTPINPAVKSDVLRKLILSLVGEKKLDEANRLVETLLKAQSGNWRNFELKAIVLREKGDLEGTAKAYDDAIRLIDRSIKAQPSEWRNYEFKARLFREKGDLEGAAKTYEEMAPRIAKDRRVPKEERDQLVEQVHYLLSGIYVDLKQIDKASDHLKTLLAKDPDSPRYNNDLGFIWADHDTNLDEAEKLIRKALDEDKKKRMADPELKPEDDKDNAAYLDSLGWVLFKKKKYAEAKPYLLKAVEDEKEGQNIEIYDHLADVLNALGEKAEAANAWKKAIKLAGDSKRDKQRKAEIEKKLEKAGIAKAKGAE